MRSTAARPVLRAMSVALLAHGEIVPRRGTTRNCAAPARGFDRRLAVGQQRGETRLLVVFERTLDMHEVNEATLDRLRAGRDAPDPRQQPLRTKWGQRARTREREELAV